MKQDHIFRPNPYDFAAKAPENYSFDLQRQCVDLNKKPASMLGKTDLPERTRRSRPLLLPERTMYREGQTPFASVFTVKLVGHLEETRVRQALVKVQTKHPLLRCVVEDSGKGPRFVLQDCPAAISLRIVARVREDDWQTEIWREWTRPFRATAEPLVRMIWVRDLEVNELILIGHHCIFDGHSGVSFLRDFLQYYDQPSSDLSIYDTLGAIEDLVPSAYLHNRRFQRGARWKARLLTLALHMKPPRNGKARRPRIGNELMYFHRWHVGKDVVSALTERCRSEGVTLLAAVSVAFIQAFRLVCGSEALTKAYSMVSARRFLPQLQSDALFGLAPGVPLLVKGLPPPQKMSVGDFWDRTRAVKTDMTQRVDRLGESVYKHLVALEKAHHNYTRLVANTDGARPVHHITFSNVGRVDLPQQYKSFRLETFYSPLVMVSPSPANTVVLSSFAGEMELAIISDEYSLPHIHAMAVAQKAMEILSNCVAQSNSNQSSLSSAPERV